MFSHNKGMVAYLLQCDAVLLKVTDNLQNVTRVLCLCQPSIILLSIFCLYIHEYLLGLVEVSDPCLIPLHIKDGLNKVLVPLNMAFRTV